MHDVDVVWVGVEYVVLQSGKVLMRSSIEILEESELMTKTKVTTLTVLQLFEYTSFRTKSIEEAKKIGSKRWRKYGERIRSLT
ncbi:hypothetical protein [Alkalihalobacillus sp. LMS39]|uniref:hypothetical protein n=1 Tax=Alkalihalobacillus sp. LMS39 TaxID=2924032 RepID=UPI001FB1D91F|nr:hypothetical protein [Alkalihalobacillus sp. LMS39]UOE92478.1 hypothetical protein MM271_14650 [Alkalihalobacillus sp. LMS39]